MKQLVMETTILKGSEVAKQRYETGLIPDVKNFEMEVVNLYPQKTYQTIEGFGAALTESAGYALSRMSEENFERVVQACYGEGGLGYTLGRVHMDSCDFSLGNYCAVTSPDDPAIRGFQPETGCAVCSAAGEKGICRGGEACRPAAVSLVPSGIHEGDGRAQWRRTFKAGLLSGVC